MCRLAGQADMGDPDILISREKGEINHEFIVKMTLSAALVLSIGVPFGVICSRRKDKGTL